MQIHIMDNPQELGKASSDRAVKLIRAALEIQEKVHFILATGASQFEMLKNLVQEDLPWERMTMFHLDEYIGMSEAHPASFRRYLRERFLEKIHYRCTYHLIKGEEDPVKECDRLSTLIKSHPIEVAMIGIGENGHLAFNDPPADFQTTVPYHIVHLDEACRLQQMGEGWFASMDQVPATAISMSIHQILLSKHLLVSVPDERKALAVRNAVEGEISPMFPASILREHPSCELFLDPHSAKLLSV